INEQNVYKPLRDYANPTADELHISIQMSAVDANSFELKPSIIQMVQNNQFGGTPNEDPNLHLTSFLELCATFKYNNVSDDAIRLRLFPFSLKDKAKMWLNSLATGSIKIWAEMVQKFLAKYFPPFKTAKLRNDITSFSQFDGETIYETWERFKELLRKCPHHALPDWLIIQTFYNGLIGSLRSIIYAAA
ncbi:retrotransposon gag domain-containing protein, partial [Bacillus amyloliquefaciens]|nr:retrotransposon gag domain-containing protein [Bacillus amyloliquefaciens]